MIKKNVVIKIKKIIKIVFCTTCIAFLSATILLFYTLHQDKLQAKRNAHNIQFVEVGMSREDVVAVMGEPNWINMTPEIEYQYTTNPDEYQHVYITFDPQSRVKYIK